MTDTCVVYLIVLYTSSDTSWEQTYGCRFCDKMVRCMDGARLPQKFWLNLDEGKRNRREDYGNQKNRGIRFLAISA